ncbi:MAG: dephospho-CoA kinase [Victivallaceae bacterium]
MVLGLTGGIGCGKSTVLKIFASQGWSVYSTDDICHSIYSSVNQKFFEELRTRWGSDIFDDEGVPDRKKIAAIAFNNQAELRWLNSIVHPAVKQQVLSIIAEKKGKNLIFEVPLLYEAGWENMFDSIVSVWSSPAVQSCRLRERGVAESEIVKRIANQLPAEKKLEKADWALINNGSFKELEIQCNQLINKIKGH